VKIEKKIHGPRCQRRRFEKEKILFCLSAIELFLFGFPACGAVVLRSGRTSSISPHL
jgi:hypothetical protein